MAEAIILSHVFPAVFNKVSSLMQKELGLLWGVRTEMEKLRSTLVIIQGVLQDAEEKQVKDKAVRTWLGQLKDASYEADDLLDELTAEALQRKVKFQDGVVNKVRNFISLSNPLVFHLKMGHKINDIRVKLDAIAKERSDYGLTVGVTNRHLEAIQREPTDSHVIENEIYGRDKDKEKIVEQLFAKGNQENHTVIPIVGMGGLGKTTLAQLAYNDQRLVGHFDLRMWVYVSDKFDIMSLTQKILESITEAKFDLLNMDILQSRLHNNLRGKKFLLVLDDIWSEDYNMSERLKNLLRCGAEGSKIIITTRSIKVASIWGTIKPYCLKGLSNNDCWIVFKRRAFGVGREESENLVVIGREIVKKCQGVPLAAKTLGSVMHSKRDEEWSLVKDSEIWNMFEESNGMLPALRLSYNYLPSHLKQCFAYCSIVPKGYSFGKDDLIQQWMAQGFIQSGAGSKQLEDVGTEYFNDFVWRSLFEVVEKDYDGDVIKCRMHDLITDLARSVAGDECLHIEATSKKDIPNPTRHLSVLVGATAHISESLCKANNLRTLNFWFSRRNIKEVPENIFIGLRYLRVLNLSRTGIKSLPSSIGKLKHLRYLNLSKTVIKMLPKSVSSLSNLQTLKLSYCSRLRELPKDISKMINLRHLDIYGCNLLTHMPPNIRQLCYLQMLPMFVISDESECGSLGELKSINLRGDLSIKKLKNVRNVIDVKEANLKGKHRLQVLRLSWNDDGKANSTDGDVQLMEELEPHPNLKKLYIENYGGENFPSWMMNLRLSNLVEISLINCKKCQKLPPLGQLLLLKILIVKKMDAVKCVHDIVGGTLFSLLKELTFEEMPNLEKWCGVDRAQIVLPCLVKLTIKKCPKLLTLPSCPSLERLLLLESNSSAIGSVANFSSLSYLHIGGFPDVACLQIGFLPKLHTLLVFNCPELTLLPADLENLTTLKLLEIGRCSKLLSIPNLNYLENLHLLDCERLLSNCFTGEDHIRGLRSLKKLFIHACPNLKSLPEGIQHSTTLEEIMIASCPEFESFPKGLQHVTTLQALSITGCDKLGSLPEWLGNLASLRYLWIERCPNIMSFPMGLQRLTTLRQLLIKDCPHLESRCDKNTGEEWRKISHVPDIFINKRKVS